MFVSAAIVSVIAALVVVGVVLVAIMEMHDEQAQRDWKRKYDREQHKKWHKHKNWED